MPGRFTSGGGPCAVAGAASESTDSIPLVSPRTPLSQFLCGYGARPAKPKVPKEVEGDCQSGHALAVIPAKSRANRPDPGVASRHFHILDLLGPWPLLACQCRCLPAWPIQSPCAPYFVLVGDVEYPSLLADPDASNIMAAPWPRPPATAVSQNSVIA